MLEDVVSAYSEYFKVDINEFQTLQDVLDNMLTRLEELTSVLQMIKIKNNDCSRSVSDDINKYRTEVTILSKKIFTMYNVIQKLQANVDLIEKQVEKAEADFGINNDNKITSFLKPFFRRTQDNTTVNSTPVTPYTKLQLESVASHFEHSL